MAVEVVSLVWPGVVVALWAFVRRRRAAALMAPALFAALVVSGGLMVPAANAGSAAALCALAVALGAACAALIDFVARAEGRGQADEDDNDAGGGGGHRRLPPPPPRGGPAGDPVWWPGFERAFWAHVTARSGTAVSARPSERS
jgi:hypothetical protein